ncbi:hypothetical protein ACHAXR_010209 [Thalassiosira sp. AJA248-18]
MNEKIHQYDMNKTYQVNEPTPAFSYTLNSVLPASLSEFERGALRRLANRRVEKGYLAALLEQDHFRQWMRISEGTPTQSWFDYLLEDTLEVGGVEEFDEACQRIQNKNFDITVNSLYRRKSDKVSFEYDLHEFHRSEEFASLCWDHLPGRLADSHPGCVMLCLSLSRMHSAWLKESLAEARKERNPELFRKKSNHCLSVVEENNETNNFFGWAIFSSMKRFGFESSSDKECKEALSKMMMREREMDDEYMDKYYDSNMSLLNSGGLTLVHAHFFEWGKQLLRKIRQAYDEDTINRDPRNSFKLSKESIMNDPQLRSTFMLLCKKYSIGSTETCNEIYDVFLSKTIHARFGVVFRHWKEGNVKKNGNVAFRTKLKAQSAKTDTDTKQKKAAASPPKDTTNKKRKKEETEAAPFSLVPAENRKKRRELLDNKHRAKRMKSQSMSNA